MSLASEFTSIYLYEQTLTHTSLDEKKAQLVVDEIKASGGDAIAVGGDVGADDFPQRIIDATIK